MSFTSDASRELVATYRAEHGDKVTARWLWLLGAPVQLITNALKDLGCTAPGREIAKWCREEVPIE